MNVSRENVSRVLDEFRRRAAGSPGVEVVMKDVAAHMGVSARLLRSAVVFLEEGGALKRTVIRGPNGRNVGVQIRLPAAASGSSQRKELLPHSLRHNGRTEEEDEGVVKEAVKSSSSSEETPVRAVLCDPAEAASGSSQRKDLKRIADALEELVLVTKARDLSAHPANTAAPIQSVDPEDQEGWLRAAQEIGVRAKIPDGTLEAWCGSLASRPSLARRGGLQATLTKLAEGKTLDKAKGYADACIRSGESEGQPWHSFWSDLASVKFVKPEKTQKELDRESSIFEAEFMRKQRADLDAWNRRIADRDRVLTEKNVVAT